MNQKQKHQQESKASASGAGRRKTGQVRSSKQLAPSPGNRIRVRTKRLDEIDETKLALAFFLLAKQICEGRTDSDDLTQENVEQLAASIDEPDDQSARRGDQEAA